jgi:hypothetical protein
MRGVVVNYQRSPFFFLSNPEIPARNKQPTHPELYVCDDNMKVNHRSMQCCAKKTNVVERGGATVIQLQLQF